MNNIGKLILAGCALWLPVTAGAWSQKGHDVVACIAEAHLTPATKSMVDSLLSGKSLVYWCNWLDNASHTPEYEYTKTWHYKNIDADETYRSARRNAKGDVVEAINAQFAILSDSLASADDKQLALKIATHLVGDIHQPMHLGHASDRGGNSHYIKFFKNKTNLHRLWDGQVLESGHKWSHTEWREELDRLSPAEEVELLSGSCPEQWAEETYSIARSVYEQTPPDYNAEFNYIATWIPVIETQLLKGGLRLADMLNTAFDPDFKGSYAPRPK